MLLEVGQVLVHAVLLVAADEPAHRIHAQKDRRVEDAKEEVVLLLACGAVVMQEVIEVTKIGEPDPGGLHRRVDALRPGGIEWLTQVQRVRNRIEHRFGRYVRL